MPDAIEGEFSLRPPDAERVAARALVLAAVACRGLIEKDAGKPGAEELRKRVVGWINDVGVSAEIEPEEIAVLGTPLGELDRKATLNATWRSEGMVVLAWALACTELPPVSVECEPSDVACGMGFLDERQQTALHDPRLRNYAEIEAWADTYLTLHWRLRQFSLEPAPMDFVAYVNACTWASLRLDHLEIVEDDLAIRGVRIDRVQQEAYRRTLSITQERHQAFNWLLGFEALYSDVTTDT